jgi:speckle-type POZ protein
MLPFHSTCSGDQPPDAVNWNGANVIKFSYTWTVHNFSGRPEGFRDQLRSPTFTAGPNGKSRWSLSITCPKGSDEESKDYVYIHIHLDKSSKTDSTHTKCQFSILNERGEKMQTTEPITNRIKPRHGRGIEFIRRDILLDESNGLLPDDKLTIFCEVGNTLHPSGNCRPRWSTK